MNRIWLFTLILLHSMTAAATAATTATATFAGGCFWCMEQPFDQLDGVISTTSGYTGGTAQNPSYEQVTRGNTGHTEAIQIVFDPTVVSYTELLEVFWKNIDPTNASGQFCDSGSQYRSGIFYHDEAQHKAALASLEQLRANKPFEQKIVTEITRASVFYPAESYHQNYYQTNPIRYKFYRFACGRDKRLDQLWGTDR